MANSRRGRGRRGGGSARRQQVKQPKAKATGGSGGHAKKTVNAPKGIW